MDLIPTSQCSYLSYHMSCSQPWFRFRALENPNLSIRTRLCLDWRVLRPRVSLGKGAVGFDRSAATRPGSTRVCAGSPDRPEQALASGGGGANFEAGQAGVGRRTRRRCARYLASPPSFLPRLPTPTHHLPLTSSTMSKPQAGSKFRLSLALPVGAVMKWVSIIACSAARGGRRMEEARQEEAEQGMQMGTRGHRSALVVMEGRYTRQGRDSSKDGAKGK